VQTICIAELKPFSPRLHGAAIGEEHARLMRDFIIRHPQSYDFVILDWSEVEGASASYLKRLLHPLFAPPGDPQRLPRQIAPIAINVKSTDLKEELDDYLAGKGHAMILADRISKRPRFRQLLGRMDGAAGETFRELQALKKLTASKLYERHRQETTNQTAWNNRLVQLVEMRVARRTRVGRFWVYEPIVQS
jgi:hypothetical protein